MDARYRLGIDVCPICLEPTISPHLARCPVEAHPDLVRDLRYQPPEIVDMVRDRLFPGLGKPPAPMPTARVVGASWRRRLVSVVRAMSRRLGLVARRLGPVAAFAIAAVFVVVHVVAWGDWRYQIPCCSCSSCSCWSRSVASDPLHLPESVRMV